MKGKTRSVAAVIVFSIITGGIYTLYWIYKFAQELRYYLEDDNIKPGMDLFLCIICFPYSIYWVYKYGKLLVQAQQKAGIPVEDNAVLYIILSIFGLFIVDMAIMQSSLNKVWANY